MQLKRTAKLLTTIGLTIKLAHCRITSNNSSVKSNKQGDNHKVSYQINLLISLRNKHCQHHLISSCLLNKKSKYHNRIISSELHERIKTKSDTDNYLWLADRIVFFFCHD